MDFVLYAKAKVIGLTEYGGASIDGNPGKSTWDRLEVEKSRGKMFGE